MHAVSRLRELRTDLRIVSSGRSFQIACPAIFGSATFCDFRFLLTETYYYYSALHLNKILCYHDITIKVIVAVRITLIKPTFCLIAKFVRKSSDRLLFRHFSVSGVNIARSNTFNQSYVPN